MLWLISQQCITTTAFEYTINELIGLAGGKDSESELQHNGGLADDDSTEEFGKWIHGQRVKVLCIRLPAIGAAAGTSNQMGGSI